MYIHCDIQTITLAMRVVFLLHVDMAAKIELHPYCHSTGPVSDPTSIGQRWKIWKHQFETYLVTTDVKESELCYYIKWAKKQRKFLKH